MNLYSSSPVSPDEIVNQLFPNIPIFIAHVIATIVLLLVLWRWVYAPFRRLLSARHKAIKDKLDDAAQKQSLANQDRGSAEQMLINAKTEVDNLLSEAKVKAYDERKEIIDQANIEATRILHQSKTDLIKQRKEAQNQIKELVESLSLEMAQKILDSEIDKTKHEDLINQAIEEIEV